MQCTVPRILAYFFGHPVDVRQLGLKEHINYEKIGLTIAGKALLVSCLPFVFESKLPFDVLESLMICLQRVYLSRIVLFQT